MKEHTVIRISGWFLAALLLYAIWFIAATISDTDSLNQTVLQRIACGFIVVSLWPATLLEVVVGQNIAMPVTLLLEGIACWEIGRFAHVLLCRMKTGCEPAR